LYNFYDAKRTIQAHEVDFTNRLRIDSLFMELQDTAAAHADKLKLGYSALIKHNLAWILMWARVDIINLPGFADKTKIRTWPKKKYKLYSLRDFYMLSSDDEIICRATTAWLPINLKSKRIVDTSDLPAPIHYQEDESAINDLPGKISELKNKEFIWNKKMKYADIDLNQHVNNIRYIELIMDSFPKAHYEKYRLKNITIYFVSESKYDDEIAVYRSGEISSDLSIIEGDLINGSKVVFQAQLNWEIM
jgi:medium-chain acyl-[acyl-carrier-protein] hydrolase